MADIPGGMPQGSPSLGRALLRLGGAGLVGTVGAVILFPGAVFKTALAVGGFAAARAAFIRARGWPEAKRQFWRRFVTLTIRRMVHMVTMGHVTDMMTLYLATHAVQNAVVDQIESIIALGGGVPRGIDPEALKVSRCEVLDGGGLKVVVEGIMAMADGPEPSAEAKAKGVRRGVGGVHIELMVRDASVAQGGEGPLSATQLKTAMQPPMGRMLAKFAALAMGEAITGTGADLSEMQPDAWRDLEARFREGGGDGVPPDVMAKLLELFRPAVPLLEVSLLGVDVVLETGGDAPARHSLPVSSEWVGVSEVLESEGGGEGDDPVVQGLRAIVRDKQAARDASAGPTVVFRDEQTRASTRGPRPGCDDSTRGRPGPRIVDAAYEERR